MNTVVARRTTPAGFVSLLIAFSALLLLSWPILFSFDLWVLKDRGNLLNVDSLLDQHLRLGVDAFYMYGLLPVTLQRFAFALCGKSYWPMLAFDAAYVVFLAYFWSWLADRAPIPRRWLLCAIVWSPILVWVNPNFPYVLVVSSILLSLMWVYEGKLSAALGAAVVGWFSVPSLPVVLTAAISALIVWHWWWQPQRTLAALARSFAPAAGIAALLAVTFATMYGIQTLIATSLPLHGATFYKAVHYGLWVRGSGLDFIAPEGVRLRYYLANRAGWWLASSLVLMAFAAVALAVSVRGRRLSGAAAVILLCASIHAAFGLFAYGPPPQHVIYDPILAAGILAGLAWLPLGAWRMPLWYSLVALGVLNHWAQIHETFDAWRDTRVASDSAGLYAAADFARDWQEVLAMAEHERVFLLSYGTGARHYFPKLHGPDSWTLQVGQVLPGDLDRLIEQLTLADVVVEDLTGATRLFEETPQIRAALQARCVVSSGSNFRFYRFANGAACTRERITSVDVSRRRVL